MVSALVRTALMILAGWLVVWTVVPLVLGWLVG